MVPKGTLQNYASSIADVALRSLLESYVVLEGGIDPVATGFTAVFSILPWFLLAASLQHTTDDTLHITGHAAAMDGRLTTMVLDKEDLSPKSHSTLNLIV